MVQVDSRVSRNKEKVTILSSYKSLVRDRYKYEQLFCNDPGILNELGSKLMKKFMIKKKVCNRDKSSYHFRTHNIGKIITDWYYKSTIGVGFDIVRPENMTAAQIKKSEDWLKKSKFRKKLKKWFYSYSYAGYSPLRAYIKEVMDSEGNIRGNKFMLGTIPYGNYYPGEIPDMGEDLECIDSHYIIIQKRIQQQKYNKLISYEREFDGATRSITTEISKSNFINDPELLKDYTIDRRDNNTTITGQSTSRRLPLRVLTNEYDCNPNPWNLGESDYAYVYDNILEVDSLLSQISMEFINNFEAKLSIPSSLGEKLLEKQNSGLNGRARHNLPRLDSSTNLFRHTAEENMAAYIQKDPGYFEYIYKSIDQHLCFIAAQTHIPKFALGLEAEAVNLRVGIVSAEEDGYIDLIQEKRQCITPLMQDILLFVAKEVGGYTRDELPEINYNDFVQDKTDPKLWIEGCYKGIVSKKETRKNVYGIMEAEEEGVDPISEEQQLLKEAQIDAALVGNTDFDFSNLATINNPGTEA